MVFDFLKGNEQSGIEAEIQITKELQKVVDIFREIAEEEDKFLNQVQNGEISPEEFERNLKDVYIEVEEDIEKPLTSVDDHVQELRNGEETDLDEEVAEKILEALQSLEKEEARFKSLIGKAEKHEENQDITETEAAEKLDKFERRELREVLDQAETKIAYCQNQLKQDVSA